MKQGKYKGEWLYENFKLYFRFIEKDCVRWEETDSFELTIETADGSIYIYDDLDRSIGSKIDTSTDEGWKKEFARRLRRKMRITGLYQVKLSELTGISQQLLSLYSQGKTLPSIINVSKLARALGCSTGDLIDF